MRKIEKTVSYKPAIHVMQNSVSSTQILANTYRVRLQKWTYHKIKQYFDQHLWKLFLYCKFVFSVQFFNASGLAVLFYCPFSFTLHLELLLGKPEPKAQVHYFDHVLSVVHPSSVRSPSFIVIFSHFWLFLWNQWTKFNDSWQKARFQRRLPSLCFSDAIGKTRWPSRPLIGWDIFDFSNKTAEQISTETWQTARSQCPLPSLYFAARSKKGWPPDLDRKSDRNVLSQVCVFRVNWETKMASPTSDWLIYFQLLL